jgi:uncharacterized protein
MRGWRGVIVLAVFVCVATALRAEEISQLHPSNYVNDFAHALNPATETALDAICKQIDEKAHAQIAVVTINSLDGRDIDGYAVDLYQKWGIGNKSTNRGVLILVAVQDHRYRTEVGYGLEPILPDGKVGGFGREAVPFFKEGDYDGGVKLMTLRVAVVIAKDAGIQLTGPSEPVRQAPDESSPLSTLAIIIVLLVFGGPLLAGIWAIMHSGGNWRGGGWTGGGWGTGGWGGGGWGGGGFGGGGGGFGGFGGGMSGGGGASGGW